MMLRAVLVLLMLLPARAQVEAAPAVNDGWVVLSVADYRALREKAYPREPEPLPPPADATLTRVDYDLRATGDSAAGTARLVVDVFKDGWVKVQVPAGIQVRDAHADGRPVSLVKDSSGRGGGTSHILLSKPGRWLISLDVVLPITAASGTEAIALPPSSAAVSRLTLTLPRRDMDLAVFGGFLAEKSEKNTETALVVYGRPAQQLTLSWKRRLEDRAAQPLRMRGSVTQITGLGEEGAQISAYVAIEVVQGVASSASFELGEGLVVNQVSGALVADWEYRPGVLNVKFLEPVEATTMLLIAGEARTAREGTIVVPLVRLESAERETGGIAVEVLGAGEIKDRQARGLDAADPADLGETVAGRESPSMAAFRYRPQEGGAPRSLSVAVARYTPEAVVVANVEEARYEMLASNEGKTLVRARFAVRNNQRSFLALKLPGDAALWSASAGGRPVRPGRAEDGALLMPLVKGRAGEDAPPSLVEVVYVQSGVAWQRDGRTRLVLPALDLQISRTGLSLYHSPQYEVKPEPGAFRVDDYAEPASEAFSESAMSQTPAEADRAEGKRQEAAQQQSPEQQKAEAEVQSLVTQYQRQNSTARVAGILPVQVPFVEFGTLAFFVSELTAEGTAPALDLQYKQTRKGE